MRNLVASLRLTARTDSSLGRTLRNAEDGLGRLGRSADRQRTAVDRTDRSTRRLGGALSGVAHRSREMGRALGDNLRQLKSMRTQAGLANKALDAVGNRWTGLASGIGLGMAVRGVGDMQERLVRFKNAAQISREEMEKFKQELYSVATRKDIRMDPDLLFGAAERYVAKTGDYAGVLRNLGAMAKGVQAYGASGEEVGDLIASAKLNLGISNGENALSIILGQGKVGSVEARDLVGYLPRTAASYAALGRQGEQALIEVGALMQAVQTATGEAAVTSTSIQALSRDLVKNTDKLEGLGVEMWDQEILQTEGRKVARPLHEIALDMITAVGGDIETLLNSGVVTDESKKVFDSLMTEGGKTALKAALKVTTDPKFLNADAADVAGTFNKSMGAFKVAWERFADRNLTKPMQYAADILNAVGDKGADRLFTGLSIGGLAIGGLLAGRKIGRVGRMLFGRKKGGVGDVLQGLGAGAGSTVPVLVTNWPGGGSGDLGGGLSWSRGRNARRLAGRGVLGRATRAGGGMMGRTGRLLGLAGGGWGARMGGLLRGGGRLLGRVFRPLGAILGIADVATAIGSGNRAGIGRSLGRLGGGAGGTVVGATLGSVVPVVGTVIGGMLGGLVGDWIGDKAGGAIAEAATSQPPTTAPGAPAQTMAGATVYITINQQPGQSARELAEKVAALLRNPDPGALYGD